MKYHIIVNSARTGEKKIARAVAAFKKYGKEVTVHRTKKQGHAGEIAAELSSLGEDCAIIVMGGDGTLHEVLGGISGFERCAMGLIPCGTGNDFAVAAKIPKNIEKAAKLIAEGSPRPIDHIELSNGLRSINAVGMGIDVDVLKKAYSAAYNPAFTDDASVVESSGVPLHICSGSRLNIKLTRPEDMELAERIIASGLV